MKSVLISINPKWCELIASGKKTIEVRKTKPMLETPFKCFIYCTKEKSENDVIYAGACGDRGKWNGKVIGEFVCDGIIPMSIKYSDPESHLALKEFPYTCLTDKQIIDYLGNGGEGYGWHISDLVLYDEPKKLREFSHTDEYMQSLINRLSIFDPIDYELFSAIKRAPQTWCYVEDAG